jgi:hypothetical protein
VSSCVSQLSIAMTKYLRQINLRRGKFILVHSVGSFDSKLIGVCAEAAHHVGISW